jgi:hypothetical protein
MEVPAMIDEFTDEIGQLLYALLVEQAAHDIAALSGFRCPHCGSSSYRLTHHSSQDWPGIGALSIAFKCRGSQYYGLACGSYFIYSYNHVQELRIFCTFAQRCGDREPLIHVTIDADDWEQPRPEDQALFFVERGTLWRAMVAGSWSDLESTPWKEPAERTPVGHLYV